MIQISPAAFSEQTKNLQRKITDPIKQRYVEYYTAKGEQNWVCQYNVIKDQTWPNCIGYKNFDSLPVWIQSECRDVHHFSPDLYAESILQDADDLFSVPNHLHVPLEVAEFLLKHHDIIKGKKIVDFACGYGRWSFFAALNQALHVLGVDARNANIDIAKAIQTDLDLHCDQITFQKSDIHDYPQNTKFCDGIDTVFLFGIMYHVHDHLDIIRSVLATDPEWLVLESGVFESTDPVIWWKEEPTFELRAGWRNDETSILVGYPSVAWFDLVISKFGYEKIDQVDYTMSSSSTMQAEFLEPRSILLYQK